MIFSEDDVPVCCSVVSLGTRHQAAMTGMSAPTARPLVLAWIPLLTSCWTLVQQVCLVFLIFGTRLLSALCMVYMISLPPSTYSVNLCVSTRCMSSLQCTRILPDKRLWKHHYIPWCMIRLQFQTSKPFVTGDRTPILLHLTLNWRMEKQTYMSQTRFVCFVGCCAVAPVGYVLIRTREDRHSNRPGFHELWLGDNGEVFNAPGNTLCYNGTARPDTYVVRDRWDNSSF